MPSKTSAASEPKNSYSICSDSQVQGRLDQSIALWKENRKTLGPFPKGAFEDHAAKNWIIYLLQGEQVVGYLLYRVAKNRAVIAHLCTSSLIRNKGGAHLLFNELISRVNDGHCRGIEVRCRSDYGISRMWPRLGFEFIRNKRGRAKSGSELTVWFYKFDVEDFFYDMMPQQEDDDLTWAILDANIIFKLADPDNITSEEALALTSDTVSAYTRYFVTPEMLVEIERKKNAREKQCSSEFLSNFERIETKRNPYESYRKELSSIWENTKSDRDRSDLNHVAYCAAAGIEYFITQDEGILKKADSILEVSGVNVLRPVEFITQLDQIENTEKYTPRAIARTHVHSSCPIPGSAPELACSFCLPNEGEKQKQLEAKIRASIAHPKQYKTTVVSDENNSPVALLSAKTQGTTKSFQVVRHDGSLFSKTMVQNLVWNELAPSNPNSISTIEFSDEFSPKANSDLLKRLSFLKSSDKWIRFSYNALTKTEKAKEVLSEFLNSTKNLDKETKLGITNFVANAEQYPQHLEVAFWPLKLSDADIPTYLVPIMPNWAYHLFDEKLAEQELWGADPAKHFNIENVYYRSPKPFKTVPGARILWYVSGNKNSQISEIRACSRLTESLTDSAKTLFKKYHRLGIYEWRDLMNLTKGDEHGQITAMRFHQTEYFKTPIKLEEFSKYGINGHPMSPKNIRPDLFAKIYKNGMNLHEK